MTQILFSVCTYQQLQKDITFGIEWNSNNEYTRTEHCKSNVHTSSCSLNKVLNFLTTTTEPETKTFKSLTKRQSQSLLNLKVLSSFATCQSMSTSDLSTPNKLKYVPIFNEISDILFIDEEDDKSRDANQGKIKNILYKNMYDFYKTFLEEVIDFIQCN